MIEDGLSQPPQVERHARWSLSSITSEIEELISFPASIAQVNELISDGRSDAEDIAAALATDPSLMTKMLRIANSASYGARSPVDSLEKAVVLMGAVQVRNLALSVALKGSFSKVDNEVVTMTDFWSHSIYCAVSARILAQTCEGRFDVGAAFTAGMLHDIGQLVMFHEAPTEYEQIIPATLDHPSLDLSLVEKEIFGFDHGDVGASLLAKWGLAPNLSQCAAFHHQPNSAEEFGPLVELIHAANAIANYAELESVDAEFSDIEPLVVSHLGLEDVDLDLLIENINESVSALMPMFSD